MENMFQSTYLYKVRHYLTFVPVPLIGFQSTYLYKVRPFVEFFSTDDEQFQSTYLYKVRQNIFGWTVASM